MMIPVFRCGIRLKLSFLHQTKEGSMSSPLVRFMPIFFAASSRCPLPANGSKAMDLLLPRMNSMTCGLSQLS